MAVVKVEVVGGLPLRVGGKKVMKAELDEKVVDAINAKGNTKLKIVKE